MEIELGILIYSEDKVENKVKPVIFYSIDALEPFEDEGKEMCTIYSSGASFISPLRVEEVRKIVSAGKINLMSESL